MYELSQLFFAINFMILGFILGSFANVVIYRLPNKKSIVYPGSHCTSCKKPIAWYDNIPLISYLILKGKCRNCHAVYPFRYFLVELLTGCVFFLLYLKLGMTWTLLEMLLFSFSLIVVSFIDFDHMILPDSFTLSGIALGLVGALLNPEREILQSFMGVLIGGGFLYLTAVIYFALRKKEGMGGGDIKLIAWIGAYLGWQAIPFVVICSSLVGAVVGILIIVIKKKQMSLQIPFGPYLALGAVLYVLSPFDLVNHYSRLFMYSVSP